MALTIIRRTSLSDFPDGRTKVSRTNLNLIGLSEQVIEEHPCGPIQDLGLIKKHSSQATPIRIHSSHLPMSPKVIIEELGLNHS